MGRFDDPIVGLWTSADGKILYPTDPVQKEYYLKLLRAWELYHQGDDSLLVEMGIFPASDEEVS